MLGFPEALKDIFMAELPQNPFAIHMVLKKLLVTTVLELISGLWGLGWGWGAVVCFNQFHVSEVNVDSCPRGLRNLKCWLFVLVML